MSTSMRALDDAIAACRVPAGGRHFKLSRIDPDGHAGALDKEHGQALANEEIARIDSLQDKLYAEARRSLLVVFQAMDTAGKDGVIRRVFGPIDPLGAMATSFKKPNAEELARGYLWRVQRMVPPAGIIGVFNRSHYEDVLVVRVHDLVPAKVWKARYDQINAFERHLTDNGTTIIKFFLSISKEEQRVRFQARLDDPTKRWKFSMGDIPERALWDDYQRAFDDAISKTSTDAAPWYVIPADRNWFRNLAVASILADTIDDLRPSYPSVAKDVPANLVID